MTDSGTGWRQFRREHPVFFWGTLALAGLFLAGALAVGMRIPRCRSETSLLNSRLTVSQKATRDSLLQHRQQRT